MTKIDNTGDNNFNHNFSFPWNKLKSVPANLLMTMAKHPLSITRDYGLNNNANANGHVINMGNFNYSDDIKRTLVSIFIHELGHHLDFDNTKTR